jgi:hypothetical protein
LEIGVADGFTLSCVIKSHLSIKELVLCDTWGDTYGGTNKGNHQHIKELLMNACYPLHQTTFLDGDSKVEIPKYFNKHPNKVFDLCFVDGDHSGNGLWCDLINITPYAKSVAVHDIRHPAHLYLQNVFYAFYETVRGDFVMMDDGNDLGFLIRKGFLNETFVHN